MAKGEAPCDEKRESKNMPGHTHTCIGGSHPEGNHKCPRCGIWWWTT